MTLKRHLLSSATALVAAMALASTASAQTDQSADDALQQDQQAAIGECDLAFDNLEQAGLDDAVSEDLRLMRESALKLDEYGKTEACNEVAAAIREILDDPQLAEEEAAAVDESVAEEEDLAEADEPAAEEDLAEAEPEAMEPTDDVAEAPADLDDEEAEISEAEPEQLDEAEAAPDEPEAADTEIAELDDPAAADEEPADLEDPAATGTATVELEEDVEEEVTAAERPTETFLSTQEEEDVLANELMGASVENPEGETLGSISDVIIHDEIGVKAVVIGVGGFLGIGQKKVAVNYQEIEQLRDENGDVRLVFAATREQLDEAPEYQTLQDQMAEAERQQMDMQQDTQMEQPPAAPTE